MLIRVKKQDWSQNFGYAPPLEEGIVNTDEVVDAFPTDSRGEGPWTKVRFRDGTHIIIHGKPDQLLPKQDECQAS